MKVQSSISLTQTAGTTDLVGALGGAAWFKSNRDLLGLAPAGLLALDFGGVRIATVSWLREAVLALLRYAAALRADITIVIANMTPVVKEELSIALESDGWAIVGANMSPSLELSEPVLLGRLDAALDEALRAVCKTRVSDAPALSRALPPLKLSAANNRLAALESKGLLRSERRGRVRLYRPVVEGLNHGL